MALKHNKKKNSGILYEQLISLMTRLVAQKHQDEANLVMEIVKKYYNKNTWLGKEKVLFESISRSKGLEKEKAEGILNETLEQAKLIPSEKLEKEKVSLINEINQKLSKDLYTLPLKNYKSLASIQILFNETRNGCKHTTPKERVDVKSKLLENMSTPVENKEKLGVDNFTCRVLLNKFNEKYSKVLSEDQQDILKGWLNYTFDKNEDKMKSLLEEKAKKVKNSLFKHRDVEDANLKPLLTEAQDKLKSFNVESVNEDSVYEIMRYFDVVESLEESKNSE